MREEDDLDSPDSADSLLAAVARIPVEVRPAEWTPPAELDEFRLIKPLGKGGMGSVWLAEDRLLERLVAIKFIATEPDAQARDRFAVEARAAARLQHTNVVSVYRYGELAGRPYLVSEYIRGDSLDKLAKPIGWARTLDLGIALARGLAAAHRHGIVHRDIKPANAILAADGDAKLVDFGLARLEHATRASRPSDLNVVVSPSSDEAGLTAPGAIAGTPRYLAPEVRRGAIADRRADVYGLGCVLYELVIGRAPILDLQDRETQLAAGSAESGLAVSSIDGRIDPAGTAFAAVVDRCLRDDPAQRFATGDELREALEELRATPAARGELPEGNPYRGLVPFDAEHRALFFGRTRDVRAVIERVRSDPFVLVTGDSGAGKSSLIRAGVLPEIAEGALEDGIAWTTVQLVPHHRPLTTLASLLAPLAGIEETAFAALLRDEPRRVARELRRARSDTKRGVLVFVDQLEELCTISDRDEVEGFSRVLAELAAGGPEIRLLATVRSDFLTRVAELPGLGTEIARAIFLLRPLSPEGAREAVVGPARAKGAAFESEALVDTLVSSVTATGARIELPLLAFTLAQLWDARDPKTQIISSRSLEAIGGVRGALARHADGVLDSLLPDQRASAKKLLLRLVTPERTRARRTAAELPRDQAVLDALVRGRLVVARGEAFELAHERLIDGWPTLASWVSDTTEAIAAHGRLTVAVADWERLGRTRDGLWGTRQLAALELLEAQDLSTPEVAFATASRRAIARKKWLLRGIAIAVPLIAIGVYAGGRLVARRDVSRRVGEYVEVATPLVDSAREEHRESDRMRGRAFDRFRIARLAEGEELWTTAAEHGKRARELYLEASRQLESAFLLDTSRDDVRAQLAKLTFDRITLAIRDHSEAERRELQTRLTIYDDRLSEKFTAPVVVADRGPVEALVRVVPTENARTFDPPTAHDVPRALGPGSYLALASAPGRAPVRSPFVIEPLRDRYELALTLPPAEAVPAGFVYVDTGEFLFGSRDDETMRRFYDAQPMQTRGTSGYLISRTELTFAQYLEFLDDLSKDERAMRLPRDGDTVAGQDPAAAQLALRQVGGAWQLQLAPAGVTYKAKLGEMIVYADRDRRKSQDWRQFPVSGISAEDVVAYAAWLDRTKRVKRARLCTELEWERAARGADGRAYPRGDRLQPDDANVDVTYDRKPGGFGPDAVGSHPASDSIYELSDTSGNVWELVTSVGRPGFVMRGGAYFINDIAAHLANRQEVPGQLRHPHVGTRICADPP